MAKWLTETGSIYKEHAELFKQKGVVGEDLLGRSWTLKEKLGEEKLDNWSEFEKDIRSLQDFR